MKKIILEILSGQSDVSSRRFVTISAFLLLAIGFLCNLFFGCVMSDNILDAVTYIAIGGLGSIVLDKFNASKTPKVDEKI